MAKILSCRGSQQCSSSYCEFYVKKPRSVIPNKIKISSARMHPFVENNLISGYGVKRTLKLGGVVN